ncbi:DUF1654 domain-containing protein [Pseudomonas sp. GXZC]|uniref:DUF1654 domain-containing protein n=1 Tax=Pseudomonas sp. GXZC TaxID=3003351 RepID=UPI0022AA8A9D|nr:DUF1654 domain-containing protein [Pseudomonas sp. GXZC]WAT31981.1 DUF1654 domain-containing protein [Pseudomonas sp. GXZC]
MDRLGLRVSAMISSPQAQFGRKVLIHRLDTDCDQDWEKIMELLLETDGLEVAYCDDAAVALQWDIPTDDDLVIEREVDLDVVRQTEVEPPF